MKKNLASVDAQNVALIDEGLLKSKIYTIRGVKVMLDADLAEIYGYSTKDFNRQVKNNIERFADDFRFQLKNEELFNLSWCKISTLNEECRGRGHNVKYLPFAFTEQGIYMLMTVLKGDLAIQQSKALIRLFKKMKDYIAAENRQFLECSNCTQIATLAAQHSHEIAEIKSDVSTMKIEMRENKNSLQKVMENFIDPSTYKHFLIFNGQKLEADIAYTQIYGMAKKSIIIVDDYVGVKTLDLLRGIVQNVSVTIYSDQKATEKLTDKILEDFSAARPDVKLALHPTNNKLHDRYIFLDYGLRNEKLFHCGASSKDAGGKITTIMQIECPQVYHAMIEAFPHSVTNCQK